MKRIIGTVALAAALAVPVAALADTPNSSDKQNAARQCKALRTAAGKENFAKTWGKNANQRNAFGKCVSSMAREMASQRNDAQSNAAKTCKAEKAQSDADFMAGHDGKTFSQFYGTGKKPENNAYGKCVSTHAKQNQDDANQENKDEVSAAKFCKGEQSKDATAFKGTYRNFGACVSKKAHELNAQRQAANSA